MAPSKFAKRGGRHSPFFCSGVTNSKIFAIGVLSGPRVAGTHFGAQFWGPWCIWLRARLGSSCDIARASRARRLRQKKILPPDMGFRGSRPGQTGPEVTRPRLFVSSQVCPEELLRALRAAPRRPAQTVPGGALVRANA